MIWQFKVSMVCFILLVSLIIGGWCYWRIRNIPDKVAMWLGLIIMLLSSFVMISLIWGILAT
jgi:hypothetical protein